ncbi:uncharacterized protein MKZ38_002860 [Zalerion maritima]|uniref:Protein kinase domain-containing protein n=1 Tax=Zalerion maritima TaxID=339359 RepID=A0AAD5WWQ7_9PEZI|nr:uncharacterized protein MKZ38_002860 [Zalerion maritima]
MDDRIAKLERLLEEEQRRREHTEDLAKESEPHTLQQYVEAYHSLSVTIRVVTDPSSITQGDITNPTGRSFPQRIVPWDSFVMRQKEIWDRLSIDSSFHSQPGTVTFESHTNLGKANNLSESIEHISIGEHDAGATTTSDGRNVPALAIENKAPHKLNRDKIVTGLESEIQPERNVINKNGEGFVFASRSLVATIATQLFSYGQKRGDDFARGLQSVASMRVLTSTYHESTDFAEMVSKQSGAYCQFGLEIMGVGASGQVYEVDEHIVLKSCRVFEPLDSDASPKEKWLYASDSIFHFNLIKDERTVFRLLEQRPHPNIVEAIDIGHAEGIYLRKYLSLGIAHSDVRIDNVLIDTQGRAVLCDFSASSLFGLPNTAYPHPGLPVPLNGLAETLSDATDRFAMASLIFRMETGAEPKLSVNDYGTLFLPQIRTGHVGIDSMVTKAWLGEYSSTAQMLEHAASFREESRDVHNPMTHPVSKDTLRDRVRQWRKDREEQYGSVLRALPKKKQLKSLADHYGWDMDEEARCNLELPHMWDTSVGGCGSFPWLPAAKALGGSLHNELVDVVAIKCGIRASTTPLANGEPQPIPGNGAVDAQQIRMDNSGDMMPAKVGLAELNKRAPEGKARAPAAEMPNDSRPRRKGAAFVSGQIVSAPHRDCTATFSFPNKFDC